MNLFEIFVFLIFINVIAANHILQSKDNRGNFTEINQPSNTTPGIVSSRRWQVSRVTQKRYEIINVLWRKTKIFDDVEISTNSTKDKGRMLSSRAESKPKFQNSLPNLKRTTPSNIEFYYSDLNDERIKRRDSDTLERTNRLNIETRSVINSPLFLFQVQYEACTSPQTSLIYTPNTSLKNNMKRSKILDILKLSKNYDDETCPVTTATLEVARFSHNKNIDILTKHDPLSTTAYDKIKFFEMYDSQTPTHKSELREVQIVLEDINFDMKHTNKSRYVKKHVDVQTPAGNEDGEIYSEKMFRTNIPTQSPTKHSLIRPAAWSEFPFMALYVYEPTQVRCDAAALSPHWLLAAASCLYRHYKDSVTNGRSAYVAYCTDNWRNAERITYVKRSFIHPRFDLKDTKYIYNIGVIEIVNAMSETCNGWAPVSLMSHQMADADDGSVGVAVGWGLDRYNANHRNDNLSLLVYETYIYSGMCPGFTEKRPKRPNVYCLSLSTAGEITDPVHGAMLLIGGKLIALHLQEEFGPLGEESALYTGVWRHIPWLLDIAREPDEYLSVS